MHKLKVYIISSISILLLITCKEKSKDAAALSGVFINNSKQQYAIVKDNKLLYPFESENKFKIQNEVINVNNETYTKIKTEGQIKSFDSVIVSYNTDNYESLGIKEFDAKIDQSSITFYDVENNITKKIGLDNDFRQWLNFSLKNRKMDVKNFDKKNKFIVGAIIYKDQKAVTIYSNAFNDSNNDLRLFMTVLVTYLSKNREKGATIEKMNFKSLDSLDVFIDKNHIGIKRVPLPPLPDK